nr:MAG TPA: hypothetical protein [Bacteriophage sp.]
MLNFLIFSVSFLRRNTLILFPFLDTSDYVVY